MKWWGRALMAAALLVTLGACSSDGEQGTDEPGLFAASFLDSGTTSLEVPGYENNPRIELVGKVGAKYVLTVTEGSGFCHASRRTDKDPNRTEGSLVASGQTIYVYLDENASGQPRQAALLVEFEGGTKIGLSIAQQAFEVPAGMDRAWAELPEYTEGDQLVYVTHFAPLSKTTTARNYTLCFDTGKRIANWVAYPLHDCYMEGSYKRSDDWAFDPEIDARYQADLSKGSFQNWKTDGIRGHQCMSNHRYVSYSSELNRQTFYSTNIMPQNSEFNGGSWNDMENIASAQRCKDTLYLVTGTFGIQKWSRDKSGTEVAMPEYCWKVLLRTRSGKTGKRIDEIDDASQLKTIGYWARNSLESEKGLKEYIVSVAEIEEKTGYRFFPMIDKAIADEVKRQNNPADWGIR